MLKILCLCLSATLQRTVHFSFFKDGEVNRSEKYTLHASGKAVNSARVLNQLEKDCSTVLCPLGESHIDLFLNLALQDNIHIIPVKTPGTVRECWTLLDKTNECTTEVVCDEPVGEYDFALSQSTLLGILEKELKNYDAFLFAGSCPKHWSDGLPSVIAKIIANSGKPFLADFSGKNLRRVIDIFPPSIIKINENEFLDTFKLGDYLNENQLKCAITEKSKELKNIIVVTRGKNSVYAAESGAFVEFPVEKVRVVNTTACGDAFSAGFLYEYLSSRNFLESLAKGTWCAARNAESSVPGSIIVDLM